MRSTIRKNKKLRVIFFMIRVSGLTSCNIYLETRLFPRAVDPLCLERSPLLHWLTTLSVCHSAGFPQSAFLAQVASPLARRYSTPLGVWVSAEIRPFDPYRCSIVESRSAFFFLFEDAERSFQTSVHLEGETAI